MKLINNIYPVHQGKIRFVIKNEILNKQVYVPNNWLLFFRLLNSVFTFLLNKKKMSDDAPTTDTSSSSELKAGHAPASKN